MSVPVPASSPQAAAPKPPTYTTTIVLAAALFGFDGLFSGQGIVSILTLVFGLPVLLIRALLARKNPPLFRRRLASAGIYLGVALAVIGLVRLDQREARKRAQQMIAACEEFKKATGAYPEKLSELMLKYIPAIPAARRCGLGNQGFTYLITGPNQFVESANIHMLVYVVILPFGKAYYVFEEDRWGFYD